MKLNGAPQDIISAVNSALVRGPKTPLGEKTSLRTPVISAPVPSPRRLQATNSKPVITPHKRTGVRSCTVENAGP